MFLDFERSPMATGIYMQHREQKRVDCASRSPAGGGHLQASPRLGRCPWALFDDVIVSLVSASRFFVCAGFFLALTICLKFACVYAYALQKS